MQLLKYWYTIMELHHWSNKHLDKAWKCREMQELYLMFQISERGDQKHDSAGIMVTN
jgi:hypothetical protein